MRIFLLALALCVEVMGANLVVPPGAETTDADSGTFWPFRVENGVRAQQIFPSNFFPNLPQGNGYRITEVAFRFDGGVTFGSAESVTYERVTISASTSTKPLTSASTQPLDSNHGLDRGVVFDSPLVLSGNSNPGLNPFVLKVPFSTPFDYDPRRGNLVIDITSRTLDGLNRQLDFEQRNRGDFSVGLLNYEGLAFGFRDFESGALVANFTYTVVAVPEPSSWLLMLLAGALASGYRVYQSKGQKRGPRSKGQRPGLYQPMAPP